MFYDCNRTGHYARATAYPGKKGGSKRGKRHISSRSNSNKRVKEELGPTDSNSWDTNAPVNRLTSSRKWPVVIENASNDGL